MIEIHWSFLEKQAKNKSACFFFTSLPSLSLYPGLETAARSHCPRKNLPSRPCCASTQRPCSEVGHGGTTLTRNHHKLPHHACHTGRLPRQCDMLWHLCGTWLSVALRDPLSSHGIFVGSPQYSSHGHFLLGMSGRVCSQHQGCDQIPALQEWTRKGNVSGDYEDAKQYGAKKRRTKIIQICWSQNFQNIAQTIPCTTTPHHHREQWEVGIWGSSRHDKNQRTTTENILTKAVQGSV